MSSPARSGTTPHSPDPGTTNPAQLPAEQDGSATGRWSVVVAALCVLATFAASLTFFQGYLDIAKLPGPIPPMDAIPHTPATAHGRTLMHLGVAGYLLAAGLGAVGLTAGIRYVRRPDSFRHGVWAIALVVCTPVLAIMLLSGMDAS